jgi:hypothetical protein
MRNVILAVILGAGCGISDDSGIGIVEDGGDTCADAISFAPCPTCCDPIAQTGCRAGEACYLSELPNETYCAPRGRAPVGSTCTTDTDCAAGLDCYSSEYRRCQQFCVVGADDASDCPRTSGVPGPIRCLLTAPFQRAPLGMCYGDR